MAGIGDSTSAWTQAWLDMQKQYMDAWTNLSRQGIPGSSMSAPFTAGAGNAWADTFERWSKLYAQGMPPNAKGVSNRLFDLGKSYLDMSERFWQFLQQGRENMPSAADWQSAVQQTFEQAGRDFRFPGGAMDPWSGFANLWGLPVSNWQRMATAFAPFPGEMEKALRAEHIPEGGDMTRAIRHFLSLPPVGYTREWQAQQQEWLQLFMDYTGTVQAFGKLLGKVVERALELFGKRMTEKTRAGESFDGLRAVYDLWIDCGEEAYAELVATADFPQLQAEMVNALMRMKRQEQVMIEEVLTALNMPTRQEMDTSHRRVYELQRQLSRLQDSLEENVSAGAPPPKTRKPPVKKASAATRRARPKTSKD